MTAKADLPPIPSALVDVALIDGPTCAAAGGISISRWHELVRRHAAPQPAIRAPRYTRWRMGDVREWLAGISSDPACDAEVLSKAQLASAAAKRVRAGTGYKAQKPTRVAPRVGGLGT
jgi:predicted DNA-binding transcriptional regulator AlpA